ncbi:MAG: hypothetical protein FWG06_00840, partial [Clostridiales bacterium]|nr:hypothetical protein [Clostridiales bacterium]
QKGIERFGGDEEMYLGALRSYAVNIPSLLETIKNVTRGNLADYAITVHGVKGSSRGISALSAGDYAEILEKLAKDGDFNSVSDKNPGFAQTIEKLIAGLNKAFEKIDAENAKPEKEVPDTDILDRLLEACEKYDMDGVDALITELGRFKYTADDGLAAWLLENAAETDSMDAPPESALNPIQVMSGHTALELIYKQETELPLKIDGEPLLAHRLLFSIPLSSSEGGLLYIGQEIYEETPQGLLFDQALQNAIFNNASDQVERVTFAADGSEVLINGQTYPYDKGGVDTGLSGRLLDRILYRTIAFYLNAYTGNVNGLQAMSTATLYEGVLRAHAGLDTDYDLGEDIIAKFNKYILSDYVLPQAILAPVRQGEEYQTALRLNESITVEIYFTAEEDLPLVSALKLVVAEDDAGNAEDAEDIINI